MSDLIDRQAAIDAIDYLLRHNDDAKRKGHSQVFINGMEDGYFMVRNNILQLPSAQPEKAQLSQEDATFDCISRQAAKRELYRMLHDCFWADDEEQDAVAVTLDNLPSAQPEIIHCKDCKNFEYDHLYIIQGVPGLGHEVCSAWGDGCKTDENGYCFLAERRTDGTEQP